MSSHSYGPTCRLSVPDPDPNQRQSSKPPRLKSHFFYTSAFALDDPLSPVPPPTTGPAVRSKKPPRPFSIYDNAALEEAWRGLWKSDGPQKARQRRQDVLEQRRGSDPKSRALARYATGDKRQSVPLDLKERPRRDSKPDNSSPKSLTPTYGSSPLNSDMTGMPFLRAPIRETPSTTSSSHGNGDLQKRPGSQSTARQVREEPQTLPSLETTVIEDTVQVPVGVSRLHLVKMPSLQIKPIYWSPLHDDVAVAWRGTWFYKNSMLPIEPDVANQLEKGYVDLAPWGETWEDELNSAIEVGADGEAKVIHAIWPKETKQAKSATPGSSRPSTSSEAPINVKEIKNLPQHDRELNSKISVSAEGIFDAEKADSSPRFPSSGVFYANAHEAYILRPNQLPSAYHNRRPILSTRRGKPIGVPIVRGFDWRTWEKIHPSKVTAYTLKAQEGAALSQSGTAASGKRDICEACSSEENRQLATDLVFVIHGIGQKLSERVESFHFTHAINAFRREMNVELVSDPVKRHLRPEFGGVMVLPVNWRSTLSFEDGGHRGTEQSREAKDSSNSYSLKDITPATIPAVRNLVNEVMSDIPYYLSHHRPKMIEAVVAEANRIYRLWVKNNPGFQHSGRVHLIAHSLGSAMALDILSKQPTSISTPISLDTDPSPPLNRTHFEFDTKSLFFCGSPAGFFLLLNRGSLLPRRDRHKPGSENESTDTTITAERDTYGSLAVDNLYNILSLNDPIAYQLNPIVDAEYAASLKLAMVPLSAKGLFSSFSSMFSAPKPAFGPALSTANPKRPGTTPIDPTTTTTAQSRPNMARFSTTVEMETHDFSREEIAERRFALLNDNLQIDFFLGSGGGPLEIQYLNMLSAHSSYWISRDFVRFVVIEIGRRQGREHALLPLRAAKRVGK